MFITNVNLRPMIAERSGGVLCEAARVIKEFTRFSYNLFCNTVEAKHFSFSSSIRCIRRSVCT
jgi:hypothetical protein